jgi:ribosomal protein S1
MNEKEITLHNLKPGYLVNGKISRLLENGIEVGFLTGFKGTIFTDHLDKCDPSKYKVGEKLSVRIIMVDPQSQSISLSILPHILKLVNVANSLAL